jgi:isoquinoline 1-oxidoreductase beta subunit
MSAIFRVTRRDFLRQAGLGTGALVFGCHISKAESLFEKVDKIFHEGFHLNGFVAMKLDGTIVIMAPRSEMGQGIRSSLAAVLADELEADWSRVQVQQADADGDRYAVANPYPGGQPRFLINDELAQFADSSRSMAIYFQAMRLMGAGIRLVMVRAAARKFGAEPEACVARQHKVWHGNESVDYHDLLLYARKVPVPTFDETMRALKRPQDWRFISKPNMPFVDAQDMVTGKAVYGADVHLPGMLTAMIVRCPVANGKVKHFDPAAALAVPGVKFVTEVLPAGYPAAGITGGVGAGFIPHAGVAVIAENTWAAWQGRRALKGKIEWDLDGNPNASYESQAYRQELEGSTAKPGWVLRHKNDVDAALAAAPKVVKADYYVPHLAQAPMEPPAAVALYENEHWEIWTATQGPELAQHFLGVAMMDPTPANMLRSFAWQATELSEVPKACDKDSQREFNEELARMLGGVDEKTLWKTRDDLKTEVRGKVKLHVTLLGGGFGRKSKPDYAIEAAFLARQHPGVPIRVQWTREDDIQFSYFHSCSNQHLEAALDADGHATAWLQRSAFPSFFASLFPPPAPPVPEAIWPLVVKARAAFHGGGKYPYGSGIERGQGLEDMPFDVENIRIENCPAQNHIRCGWMRSVSNIFHAFAIGSFVDELAVAAGRDCRDYLLELIGQGRVLNLEAEGIPCFDNNGLPTKPEGQPPGVLAPYPNNTGRLRGVVERVAKESGWDEKVKRYKGTRRGLGIAAHRSFLSYAAMVIDVSLDEFNELTIHEIYGAIDCGIAVNPDRITAQMEGGIVYGLSLALLGEITVKDGRVQQHNFDDYPVLRLYQTPKKISISILESTEVPTGVGEIPVPPVAPALANAIVAAGGTRAYELPLWKKFKFL